MVVVVREPHELIASLTCFQGLLIRLWASSPYGCGQWPIICSETQKKQTLCSVAYCVFKTGDSCAACPASLNENGNKSNRTWAFFFEAPRLHHLKASLFKVAQQTVPSVPGSGRTGLQGGPHHCEVLNIKAKGLCGGQWRQTIHTPAGLALAENCLSFGRLC